MNRTFLLVLALGCSEQSKLLMADAATDFGGAELDGSVAQLRVDVIPSSQHPDIPAQSWIIPESADLQSLNVQVSRSIEVSGTGVGYEATPYGAEVPGIDNVPMDAQVTLVRPGTINGATVATDELGRFSVLVPPSTGYRLSIVPRGAPTVPFSVEEGLRLAEDTDLDTIDLGYGEPIFGEISFSDGAPVEGMEVQALHAPSGVAGAAAVTDEQGHYMIRVPPGDLQVVAAGSPGSYLPTLTETVEVTEEGGSQVDFDLGDISPIQVSGSVVGQGDGHRQKDIKVRFVSSGLAETEGDLEVETETDGDGLFSRSILPGEWLVEFVPPFDSDQSPVAQAFTLNDQVLPDHLAKVELPDRVRFNRTVVNAAGARLPGAVVNAQEIGFDGYIYSTTADSRGRIDLHLPAVDMQLTLIPATSSLAVTQVRLNPASHTGFLTVTAGQAVTGVVRSDGDPVGFALVEVREEGGTLLASTISGPDGEFSVQIEAPAD